jgi:hypothetical protein
MEHQARSEERLPPDIPQEAVPFLKEMGYLEPERLSTGAPAPEPPLYTLSGDEVRLSECWREKPLVLVFGSYT